MIATFQGTPPSQPCAFDGTLCCISISGTPGSGYTPVLPYTCTITSPLGTYTYAHPCFTNLTAGTYTIFIQDNAGATGSVNAVVPPSPEGLPPTRLVTTVPAGCSGGTGSACVNASGGTGSGFTYTWVMYDAPYTSFGTASCASGLPVGHYVLTVQDIGVPCYYYHDVYIYEATVAFTGSVFPATCTSPCNGYISLQLPGITLPATISWIGTSSGSQIATTSNSIINGLCAGTYQVTVTSLGCSSTQTFTIINSTADIIITVCSNLVWNPGNFGGQTDITLAGNLIISPGACLTIEGMTIRLQPGRFIRIMGTGTLTTTNSTFDAGCGDWWQGFEVSSLQPNTNSANRGILNMSANCKITHAIFGICNYQNNGAPVTFTSGGRMEVSDTKFVDNNIDLSLRSYYPSGTLTAQNRGGHFENCTFELYNYVAGATAANLIGKARVQMMNIADLHFRNCRAENFNPNYLSTNSGGLTKTFATASYANFVWNGCSTDGSICSNSFIKGYVNGFRSSGDLTVGSPTAGNVFPGPIISNAKFECYRGIYASTVSTISITDNSFKLFNFPNTILPPGYFYSTSIAYAAANPLVSDPAENLGTNFLFAGNDIDFFMPSGSLGNMQTSYAAGILVYNAGEHSNYIIKNTFKGCGRAGQFDDRNKGSDFDGFNAALGLHYECNTLDACRLDFVIRDPLGVEGDDAGVFGLQRQTFVIPPLQRSAGNNFVTSTSNSNQDDIANGIPITSSTHRYVYHSDELNANGITEMSPAIQNLIQSLVRNTCTYDYSAWTSDISNGQLIALMSNYTQTRDIYLALVDGGNSTNMKGRVENISLAQALTLYQDLLALSPNLSEEVMAKLVQKEQEFPATLLTMVLASNPSAVKSAMIQKALSERNTPLNSYQMGLIATGWNGSSPKELLESEMTFYRLELSKQRFRLAQDLAKTESSGNHLQTLLGSYFENDFLTDRLVKADLLMRYGSFTAGMDMLLSSESHFNLEDSEKDGIALYAHLLEIEHAILTRQDQTLSQTETAELLAIASSEPCGYGKRAYHLLVCYSGYDDVEINCDQPDDLFKRLTQIAAATGLSKEKNGLIAYPNPVKGEILVVKFDRYFYDANKVAVYTLDGKLQYEMNIESGSTEIILPAIKLINGPNHVCLFSDSGILLDSVIILKN